MFFFVYYTFKKSFLNLVNLCEAPSLSAKRVAADSVVSLISPSVLYLLCAEWKDFLFLLLSLKADTEPIKVSLER